MSRLLLAFISTFASLGFACRCDFSLITALQDNPLSSRLAVVGKAEVNKTTALLRVKYAWTPFESTVPIISNESSCSLNLIPGRDYLLLSFQEHPNLEKMPLGLNMCNAIVLDVSKAQSIVEKLEKFKPVSPNSANPSWKYCQKDEDCVLRPAPCGESEGVNKKFASTYGDWSKKIAPTLNCVSNASPTHGVKCVSSFCVGQ